MQAAYDEQVADVQPAPEFNAAHILVDSEDEAKALKAEIDGGKDFAALAKAIPPTARPRTAASSAGSAPARWCPSSSRGARSRSEQVSEPVKSQFGWHVIKLNEKRETRRRRWSRRGQRSRTSCARRRCEAKLDELRAAATIERPETGMPPAAIRESDLLTN